MTPRDLCGAMRNGPGFDLAGVVGMLAICERENAGGANIHVLCVKAKKKTKQMIHVLYMRHIPKRESGGPKCDQVPALVRLSQSLN